MALQNIDGNTLLGGLIGRRISYSLSPLIYNSAIGILGYNKVYLPFDLADESMLPGFLESMWNINAWGFNITQPYKESVSRIINSNDSSINMIYRGPSGWVGRSTDALGLDRGLGRLGKGLLDYRKIVLLGTGGAVKAILCYLKSSPTLSKIQILFRTNSIAEGLIEALQAKGVQVTQAIMNPGNLKMALGGEGQDCLLIQATSAPVLGESLGEYCASLETYSGSVVDLVYKTPSAILQYAISAGLPCQDGLPMLIEQARAAQEIWWGKSIDAETISNWLI